MCLLQLIQINRSNIDKIRSVHICLLFPPTSVGWSQMHTFILQLTNSAADVVYGVCLSSRRCAYPSRTLCYAS